MNTYVEIEKNKAATSVETLAKAPHENFKFIQESFSALYQITQQAEQYYQTDSSSCLVKLRCFCELICHEISELLIITPPLNGDLNGKIGQLASSRKVPDYIIKILDELRIEGNRSAHVQRDSHGNWQSQSDITDNKLKHLMQNMHEATQYLAFKLNGQEEIDTQWSIPERHEIASHIYESFSGNTQATYAIAKHFYEILNKEHESNAPKNLLTTIERNNIAHDLSYWLDRCHRQGHEQSWLLYARSYQNKFLNLPANKALDDYYKTALKYDSDGQASYAFALYLYLGGQQKRSLELMQQAAEKHHIDAIRGLQDFYYEKNIKQYNDIILLGLIAEEKTAYLLDFVNKLNTWEQDKQNQEYQKQAKTALISAEARQAPGIKFYSGYCIENGFLGKTQDRKAGINMMIKDHQKLPAFLPSETLLFRLINAQPEYEKLAIRIAPQAIYQASGLEKADFKYESAMLCWSQLKQKKRIKTPLSIKSLIREAAKEGLVKAQQFLTSPYGKVLMRDNSLVHLREKTTSKQKNKRKKKKNNF